MKQTKVLSLKKKKTRSKLYNVKTMFKQMWKLYGVNSLWDIWLVKFESSCDDTMHVYFMTLTDKWCNLLIAY